NGFFAARSLTFHHSIGVNSPIMFSLDNDGIWVTNGNTNAFRLTDLGEGIGLPARANMGRMSVLWAAPFAGGAGVPVGYAMIGNNTGGNPGLGQAYQGFFRSDDVGFHWTQGTTPCTHTTAFDPPAWDSACGTAGLTLDGSNVPNAGAGIFVSSQQFYDQALAAPVQDTQDASTIVFGGIGIYLSQDGGATWSFLAANGGTHADQHAIAWDTPNRNRFFLGNDGGVFACTLVGTPPTCRWTSLNDTINSGQIMVIAPHPTNNNRALAGFQDNGTQLYTGNLGWSFRATGDGGFVQYDHLAPSFAYHTFASGIGADSDAAPDDGTDDGSIIGGNVSIPRLAASNDGGLTWDDAPDAAIRTAITSQNDATDNA